MNDNPEVLHVAFELTTRKELRDQVVGIIRKHAHGKRVGYDIDAYDLAEDVLAKVQMLTVQKADKWLPLSEDERRGWVYLTAKNLAMREVAQAAKAVKTAQSVAEGQGGRMGAPLTVRPGQRATYIEEPDVAAPVESPEAELVRHVRLKITQLPGVGGAGWEKIVTRAKRSQETREALLAAMHAIGDDRDPDLSNLIRHINIRWEDWAVDRITRGHNLSTLDAVTAGIFTRTTDADRKLRAWFIKHRSENAPPLCSGQIITAGLVDHVAIEHRSEMGQNVLNGYTLTHAHQPHPSHKTCLMRGCNHGAERHGIDLDRAKTTIGGAR